MSKKLLLHLETNLLLVSKCIKSRLRSGKVFNDVKSSIEGLLNVNNQVFKQINMRTLTNGEMMFVSGGKSDKCHANNGWGNGDDNAPGNSLYRNRAENNVRPGAAHKETLASPTMTDSGCGCGIAVAAF